MHGGLVSSLSRTLSPLRDSNASGALPRQLAPFALWNRKMQFQSYQAKQCFKNEEQTGHESQPIDEKINRSQVVFTLSVVPFRFVSKGSITTQQSALHSLKECIGINKSNYRHRVVSLSYTYTCNSSPVHTTVHFIPLLHLHL